jgi:hypothetical protein
VPEDDALLVGKLAEKGYRLVSFDPTLGIAEYRRVSTQG